MLKPRPKFIYPVLLVLLFTTGFFAYKYYTLIKIGIIAEPVNKSRCAPCMEYNNVATSDSKLDFNLLKTMAFNYQNPLLPDETHSVWFRLETLKKFIYQIESKSCTCPDSLGIRIYYGRYPSPPNWSPFMTDLGELQSKVITKWGTNVYGGIHTLFMVPTIDKPSGSNIYHYDFDPADGICNPYSEKKYITMRSDTAANPLYTTVASGTFVTALMAMNHGDACPPPPTGMNCPDAGAFFNK